MSARHRTPSADVASSILDSAALLLEHEGPDALTVRRIADLYRRLALDHPASYRLMFMKTVPGYEPSPDAMAVAGDAFDELVRAVEHLMVDGRFASGDSREIAQRIWASCHGWISLEMFGIGFVDNTSAGYDALVDLLLTGLRPLG